VEGRERLLRRFAAEEVASGLRHPLVNKIAAVGALTFHLRRQLPEGTPEAATKVLPMIDAELAQATQTLDLRFVGPVGPAAPLALGEVVEGLLASLERPPGVEIVGPQGPSPRATIDRGELDLALFCLVENALEAVGDRGTVTVRWGEATGMVMVEVADDGPGLKEAERRQAREPFFTTKPGRLGVGLNVAGRIAQRWRGTLELAGARKGLVARLALPVPGP
jgi:C4-dicarboxylate-specific signal transduction histidine kinase